MHDTPTTLLVAERDENTRAFLLDNLAADGYEPLGAQTEEHLARAHSQLRKTPADALGAAVTDECLRRGLSMNIVRSGEQANCFRIAPPLSVTRDEIDLATEILDEALRSALDSRERSRAGAPSL